MLLGGHGGNTVSLAQYWHYRGHAVQDRIGCYRRRQHLRRCNHQVSQGRGPCGRLLMARPAVLGCIWACGVKRRARAHAIMARVSRSEAASSLSRRSRPPSMRVHSSLVQIARSEFQASATGRYVCNTQSRLDAQPASANFPAMIRPRRAIPGPAHPSTLMAVQAVSVATYRR